MVVKFKSFTEVCHPFGLRMNFVPSMSYIVQSFGLLFLMPNSQPLQRILMNFEVSMCRLKVDRLSIPWISLLEWFSLEKTLKRIGMKPGMRFKFLYCCLFCHLALFQKIWMIRSYSSLINPFMSTTCMSRLDLS